MLMQAAFESGWLLHETFSVCSWIYQSGAPWHLILQKPWHLRLWIFHLGLWIHYSL